MRTIISTLGLLILVGCNAATTQPTASSPPASSAAATPSPASGGDTPPVWTATADMVGFHFDHTATLLLDGRVLVAGGGGEAIAAAELYDPGRGTWSATGSLTTARFGHTATLLPDGRVLVAGGSNDGWLASVELYDPRSGTWSSTGSMATARGWHTATLLPDGTVLVTGGFGPGGDFYATSSVVEVYDPKTAEWTATASMSTARGGHTATLLSDGAVLVVGGDRGVNSIGSPLASAELYDPSSGRWTATGSMAEARFAFRTTLLADGTVLVAGGRNDSDTLATAELYDPSSGRWTATGSMTEARSNSHTATLLLDGAVLVTGGGYRADDGSPLASAELYDPGSGLWTATASMVVGRVAQTATLFPDGRVLVAGGDMSGGGSDLEGGPVDIASAELYDP